MSDIGESKIVCPYVEDCVLLGGVSEEYGIRRLNEHYKNVCTKNRRKVCPVFRFKEWEKEMGERE